MTNSSSLETSYRGNPHDMLARTALQIPQIFSELIEVLFSEEALIHLDFDSVTSLPTDYHDQQGRLRQIDALGQINVRTKKSQDSHPQKLIVLCEHKSTAKKNTLNAHDYAEQVTPHNEKGYFSRQNRLDTTSKRL